MRWGALTGMVVCALALSGGVPEGMAGEPCPGASAPPVDAGALACAINGTRASHGLPPVRLDRRLSRAARRHAADMAANDYFSHEGRDGSTFSARIERTGYLRGLRRWCLGEVLAWGSGDAATARSMVRAWLGSPGHRAVLLDPDYRDLGVGVADGLPVAGGDPGTTVAAELGATRGC